MYCAAIWMRERSSFKLIHTVGLEDDQLEDFSRQVGPSVKAAASAVGRSESRVDRVSGREWNALRAQLRARACVVGVGRFCAWVVGDGAGVLSRAAADAGGPAPAEAAAPRHGVASASGASTPPGRGVSNGLPWISEITSPSTRPKRGTPPRRMRHQITVVPPLSERVGERSAS